MDVTLLGRHLAACAWPFLMAACVANLLSGVLKAETWRCLLDGVDGARGRLRALDLVSPLMVGALVNSGLPGRPGEVAKVMLARRRVALRGGEAGAAHVAGSIAAEHLVSTLAWGGLAAAAVCVLPAPGAVRALTLAAAAGCLAATLLAALRPAPARRARGWLRRPWAAAVEAWEAVHQGLRGVRRPRAMAGLATVSVGQWAAQWAAILLTLHATGLGRVGMGGAALVLVTLTLSHAVPLMPGGVGMFQVGAMLPLTAVYGVDAGQALAFGLLLQLGETAVSVCAGAACLARENRRRTTSGPREAGPRVLPSGVRPWRTRRSRAFT